MALQNKHPGISPHLRSRPAVMVCGAWGERKENLRPLPRELQGLGSWLGLGEDDEDWTLRALSQGGAEPDKGEFTDLGALTQDVGFSALARPPGGGGHMLSGWFQGARKAALGHINKVEMPESLCRTAE